MLGTVGCSIATPSLCVSDFVVVVVTLGTLEENRR